MLACVAAAIFAFATAKLITLAQRVKKLETDKDIRDEAERANDRKEAARHRPNDDDRHNPFK